MTYMTTLENRNILRESTYNADHIAVDILTKFCNKNREYSKVHILQCCIGLQLGVNFLCRQNYKLKNTVKELPRALTKKILKRISEQCQNNSQKQCKKDTSL